MTKYFTLPELPYAYDALEPYIDEKTMKLHHGEHHRTYVDKLNEALADQPAYREKPLEILLTSLGEMDARLRKAVRNNGGGHYNHSFLWTLLTPSTGSRCSDGLKAALERDFGGFDAFRGKFSKEAEQLFGSGYVWLCVGADDRLVIKSLPDQDTPLMRGLKPIFLMDVWEHAYYLKHQNRRPEYIEAFWKVVNWDEVSKRWEAEVAGHKKLAA